MVLWHIRLQGRWLFAFAAKDAYDSYCHAPAIFGNVQLIAWRDAIFLGERFVNQRCVLIVYPQMPALL